MNSTERIELVTKTSHTQQVQYKRDVYTEHVRNHLRNERILKGIYFTLGFSSTIASSVIAFTSGLLTLDVSSPQSIQLNLVLSCFVLGVNAFLNFGRIEEKMSKHHDMRNQYTNLITDIDEFLSGVSRLDRNDVESFNRLLCEKQKLLQGYDADTFCF